MRRLVTASVSAIICICCWCLKPLPVQAENLLVEFTKLLFNRGDPPVPVVPQKILVIGAGQGRTGTSSLVVALARLGLKTYHMKDGVMETPGHLDLWHDFFVRKSISIDDVFDRIEADGFNATVDAPTNMFFLEQFKRNPSARVILSLRKGGGESWVKSLFESVMQFHPVLIRAPLRWIPRANKISRFWEYMNRNFGVPMDANEVFLPDRSFMAAAYDSWTEYVITNIPDDQLLIFYPQDGWPPLCRFLSPLSPYIATRCDLILSGTGEPFPHVNDTATIQRVVGFFSVICSVTETIHYSLIVGSIACIALWLMKRRNASTLAQSAKRSIQAKKE